MYDYKRINFKLTKYGTREDIRREIVLQFLREIPGKGRGDNVSRYQYYVETLSDGNEIVLTRPSSQGWQILRGFDFRIDVPGMEFGNKSRKRITPKHDDIVTDLKNKKKVHPTLSNRLFEAIKRVYECEDVEQVCKKYKDLDFGMGFSVEFILKILNWMFIEQDMRDWNFSGRKMLMDGIENTLK